MSNTESYALYGADLVDKYFPKNDTAALGGPATPGRGSASVMVGLMIVKHEDAIQAAKVSLLEELREAMVVQQNNPWGIKLINTELSKLREPRS